MKLSLENKQWREVVIHQSRYLITMQLSLQNKQWGEVVMQKSSEPDYHETIFREPQCPILGFHCFCFYTQDFVLGHHPQSWGLNENEWVKIMQSWACPCRLRIGSKCKTHKKKESEEFIFFCSDHSINRTSFKEAYRQIASLKICIMGGTYLSLH